MKDLGLLMLAAALMACGFGAAWQSQELRYAAMGSGAEAIAANNLELRSTSKTLRNHCRTRPRMQRDIIFTPGQPI